MVSVSAKKVKKKFHACVPLSLQMPSTFILSVHCTFWHVKFSSAVRLIILLSTSKTGHLLRICTWALVIPDASVVWEDQLWAYKRVWWHQQISASDGTNYVMIVWCRWNICFIKETVSSRRNICSQGQCQETFGLRFFCESSPTFLPPSTYSIRPMSIFSKIREIGLTWPEFSHASFNKSPRAKHVLAGNRTPAACFALYQRAI
jgi:hypothetical protein